MFELDVPDMTCNHCAATIARAVKDVDGAVRCEIDVAAKRVRIDSSKAASEFAAAVAGAGYTPTLVR